MNQTILYRVILPTGSIHCSTPNDVNKKASRLLHPWLARALVEGGRVPLPLPVTAGYDGLAEETADGLIVTLSRRAGRAEAVAVATIGVAQEKVGGYRLWRTLLRKAQAVGPEPPGSPWCLLSISRETAIADPEAEEWLGDLADSLARVWLERKSVGPDGPGASGSVYSSPQNIAAAA
ncbi:MAG: hypothetical protein JWN73_2668 [Betaproteobacteria bacterium]|nr:hypothetical protein [Betaproteobacteria bacterium]